MSRTHVVVGAGIVGSTLAELLANDGQEVIVVTRSGAGPTHKNIKRIAADVSDLSKLLEIAPSAACKSPWWNSVSDFFNVDIVNILPLSFGSVNF